MRYVVVLIATPTPLLKLPASASTGLAWRNATAMAMPQIVAGMYYERASRRQQPIPSVPFPLMNVLHTTAESMTWINKGTLSNPLRFEFLPRQYPNPIYFLPIENIIVHVSPSRYAIEIRDKNFRLKDRIENAVTNLQWEWNRIGGCGKATMTIDGNYLRLSVSPDDDVRIYLPNATSGATLWYRGYVETVTPSIDTGDRGTIRLECMGYFGWMDRIIAQVSNAAKTYTNQEVSLSVVDLIDSFVVPNSSITRGTVDGSTFVPDSLGFKVSIKDALKTCADLIGSVEYGVDTSLQFFWYNRSEIVSDKVFLGGNVVKISDRIDFKSILNKIYFEGGDVSGAAFAPAASEAADSQSRYGLHEDIVSNGAITTNSVANRYMSSLFTQKAKPSRQMAISLKNTTKRFEATLPMGAIAVVDPAVVQSRYLWGITANGGANKLWGTILSGGSGVIYGGVRKEQIDRVTYTLSPEDGRINADVQFGDSLGISRASATIAQIEQIQNALRQRSL